MICSKGAKRTIFLGSEVFFFEKNIPFFQIFDLQGQGLTRDLVAGTKADSEALSVHAGAPIESMERSKAGPWGFG